MNKNLISKDSYSDLRGFENLLIPHRHFALALKRLQFTREAAINGIEPRHTLLVGEAGAGKTWIARYLQKLHPITIKDGGKIIPILYIETPAVPTLKGLAEAILSALGDLLAHRGTAADKCRRALDLIKKCRVELIIFDEFQHFYDNGQTHTLQAVADWLKLFIEDAQCPCLLMGLPRSENILHVNEQLRRRFSTRLELPAFSIDSEDEEIEFRSVLKEISKHIPTTHKTNLADIDLSRRLHFASNGLIGYLRKLIAGALEIMLIENRAALDIDLLERAFVLEIWKEGLGALNPFNRKFPFRRLDRQGEPFSASVPIAKGNLRKLRT